MLAEILEINAVRESYETTAIWNKFGVRINP